MRISHKHRFVFLSKPRTGSTSVRLMLNEYSDVICNARDEPSPGFHPHLNWRATIQLFADRAWDFDAYYSFTTVRNPWDLVVSYYAFFRPDVNGRYSVMPSHDPNRPMPFPEWVFCGRTWDIGRKVWRADIAGPGIEAFAFGDDGRQMVDGIFPIERLEELAAELGRRIDRSIHTVHTNRSRRDNDYRSYYDSATRDRVGELFAKDVELGNYDF